MVVNTIVTATRYHDFSYGHRVAGHENKCANLHGHNGRVHFTVAGPRDSLGRVQDFGAMKSGLCQWVEDVWDHKFLVWSGDTALQKLFTFGWDIDGLAGSIVTVPFNPTAENMAEYLLRDVGPRVLSRGLTLVRVQVDETRKCSATAELSRLVWLDDNRGG